MRWHLRPFGNKRTPWAGSTRFIIVQRLRWLMSVPAYRRPANDAAVVEARLGMARIDAAVVQAVAHLNTDYRDERVLSSNLEPIIELVGEQLNGTGYDISGRTIERSILRCVRSGRLFLATETPSPRSVWIRHWPDGIPAGWVATKNWWR